MTKGTPSFGRKNKKLHIACRRCGRHSYHITKKVCSACGFGKSKRLKKLGWQWKTINRERVK
jgi:large subunit ribosomal protein L37e